MKKQIKLPESATVHSVDGAVLKIDKIYCPDGRRRQFHPSWPIKGRLNNIPGNVTVSGLGVSGKAVKTTGGDYKFVPNPDSINREYAFQ